jgi:DNA-binding LacI/PurR family transcriptional regulator
MLVLMRGDGAALGSWHTHDVNGERVSEEEDAEQEREQEHPRHDVAVQQQRVELGCNTGRCDVARERSVALRHRDERPTGVFAYTEWIATRALRAVQEVRALSIHDGNNAVSSDDEGTASGRALETYR